MCENTYVHLHTNVHEKLEHKSKLLWILSLVNKPQISSHLEAATKTQQQFKGGTQERRR